jgi:hypothetical protein
LAVAGGKGATFQGGDAGASAIFESVLGCHKEFLLANFADFLFALCGEKLLTAKAAKDSAKVAKKSPPSRVRLV